jgi:maltose alpha-D-glucosyltransferase / alpha-amylase
VRVRSQAFGRGRFTMLHPGNRKVLAYLREYGDEVILCVANLSRVGAAGRARAGAYKGRVPVEMMGRNAFPPIGELPYLLTLPAYGFFWFRLATDARRRDWHTERLPVEDLPVLVLFDGWNSFFRDRVVPWRIAMAEKTWRSSNASCCRASWAPALVRARPRATRSRSRWRGRARTTSASSRSVRPRSPRRASRRWLG